MRRIVIDTNCLLAILPSRSPYHIVWTEFLADKLEICVSNEILMEYEEILSEKTSHIFADSIIQALLNRKNLIRVSPVWRFNMILQDPDDNKFVDCAVCGQAEYIVSNDKHFGILRDVDFPPITLVTIQEFIDMLKE
ncbi:MAG: putative toxin-antitoxin system toxin component, PIN family [Bacteroidaceae bacterium]|nr:putative toxin-antitoxin system toxin component, PIN family [Bacteroidaceae bacterium]